jgi:large subunit ribosomal protein L25
VEEITLQAKPRTALGKKCKALRREGVTPIHLYGPGVASQALQCDTAEVKHVLARAGRTALVDLKIDGTKKPAKVLVRDVRRHYAGLVHVDFFQVKLTEKLTVDVPIVLTGESPATKTAGAMVLQNINSIAVECLPTDIPDKLEVDLGVLEELDQAIHVRDLDLGEGVATLIDPDQMIVKVAVQVMRVEEEAAPTEEAVEGAEEEAEVAEEPEQAASEDEAGETSSEE